MPLSTLWVGKNVCEEGKSACKDFFRKDDIKDPLLKKDGLRGPFPRTLGLSRVYLTRGFMILLLIDIIY